MKNLLLLFIITALNIPAAAQESAKRDSLLSLLKKAKEDTIKIQLLYRLAVVYEMNNLDSAAWYLQESKKLTEKLNYTMGRYLYEERSAVLAATKGDYTTGLEYTGKALAFARKLGDSSLVAITLGNMGFMYGYLSRYQDQVDYLLQARGRIEQMKDSSKLSPLYAALADAYTNLRQHGKALDFELRAVRLYENYHKRNDFINRSYIALGRDYLELQLYDSAVYYCKKAVPASIKKGDIHGAANAYGILTNALMKLKRFSEMMQPAEESLKLAKELQSPQAIAAALQDVATAAFFNGNTQKAKEDILAALEIATRDSLRYEMQNGFTFLSTIYAKEGNYTGLIDASRIADSMRNAEINEQVINSTSELQTKYETAKKEAQIKLQQASINQKNTLNYILIGSAAALLFIVILSYRNYRNRQKLQQQRIAELETQQQLTATEAVLKGEAQERTRLAKDLHDGLGGMLSGIKFSLNTMKGNLIMTPDNAQAFERSIDMLDGSIQEMRRVAHNMMPEALVKFGLDTALKDFCLHISQSGALQVSYQSMGTTGMQLDQTVAVTIYRIVQELINNTIKHAAAQKAIVQLSVTGPTLSITVEDDGKGFDIIVLRKNRGIGWSNIQNRVSFLNARFDVQSAPGKGTSVLIEVPIG